MAYATIKMAYAEENMKVNANSIRAITQSWTLYKGASTESFLEAADRVSESNFLEFLSEGLIYFLYVIF